MRAICQLYLPSFYRSYNERALKEVSGLLPSLKKAGFSGIYLIGLWRDGGYDNGFDVVEYRVNPSFGTDEELNELIRRAHRFNLAIGVDVVPNHVSDQNILAQNCLNGMPGYEDCLYWVSRAEAERLTEAGVPSFFGRLSYSDFGDKYVRSTFADYHQLNLNWRSQMVQQYFAEVFARLKAIGVNFVRIDCGMMLLEDVSRANPKNPLACMNPRASIEAIHQVSGGMPMFFEWFDPSTADLFNDLPECYALDCSYIMSGRQNLKWGNKKLVPLLGGHDQMTAADRGINIREALDEMAMFEYGFLDIQTIIGWETEPDALVEDAMYDANLQNQKQRQNQNQRYRARRPIEPILSEFRKRLAALLT